MKENLRIIISGGGTGGHIFPAVSIANAIKELQPDAEILFVGAEGRMEMRIRKLSRYRKQIFSWIKSRARYVLSFVLCDKDTNAR